MKISEAGLGVKILEPRYFEDVRGYFCETYSSRTLADFGITHTFVQDSHSLSVKAGTLRGIHFQLNPNAQVKLVRCLRGRVMDYAVDLRKDSPTYKQWVKTELSDDNRLQTLIPAGFGHAFLTLTDNCEMLYKMTDWYMPELGRAIAYNDPDIGIEWEIDNPILSPKDINAPFLRDSDVNFK